MLSHAHGIRMLWEEKALSISNQTLHIDQLPLLDAVRDIAKHNGIQQCFPVQTAVIPWLLRQLPALSEFMICAPTGSGKTLCFVMPIVHLLAKRVIVRLRALVVAPTRDLAVQIAEVFRPFTESLNLRLALCIGQESFRQEAAVLVQDGKSAVDILVTTPGRLTDHLSYTEGFTLQDLEFLVIDEADRLLAQSYQDWVIRVLEHAHNDAKGICGRLEDGRIRIQPKTCRSLGQRQQKLFSPVPVLRKWLFSATLTRDPRKLAQLGLKNPVFFSTSQEKQFMIPDTLEEFMIIFGDTEDLKPLALIELLLEISWKTVQAVVFSSSVDTTRRLAALLKLFFSEDSYLIAEFSGAMSQPKRSKILGRFKESTVKLLICSDAISRGMDIDMIQVVINYDSPSHAQTYIHRVGRTARAGKRGTSYSLLRSDQVFHFRKLIINKTSNKSMKEHQLDEQHMLSLTDRFQQSLSLLQQQFRS